MPTSFFVVLQYDGTHFAGWQKQARDRTVQGDLETTLAELDGRRVVTHAAGRTDAGVHALGQVVSFRTAREWPPRQLLRALRGLLPADLFAARLGEAPTRFHARNDAVSRRYRYAVGWDPDARSPFRRPYEWALGESLDLGLLRDAAALLSGTNDFRAFAAAGQKKAHYRCSILESRWDTRDRAEGCIFTIEADRFLHRMVRFLVGTMVDVARGRRPLRDIRTLLRATTNEATSPPAPPHGLYLVGARYPNLDEGYVR